MTRRAFTLVELLSVMLILALIAGTVTVSLSATVEHADFRGFCVRLQSLDQRARLHARTNGAVLLEMEEMRITLSRASTREHISELPVPTDVAVRVTADGELVASILIDRQGRSADYSIHVSAKGTSRAWRGSGLTGHIIKPEEAES